MATDPLPPAGLRPGGNVLRDDSTYLEDACSSVRELQLLTDLNSDSRVLDVGCGPGRLLIGLRAELGGVAEYVGVDVSRAAIEWAESNLQGPGARFAHVDVPNARYNAQGSASVGLPLGNDSYDVVALFSVFSHMRLEDIVAHLKELDRVLADDGRIYLTAFVEDGVQDQEENPESYLMRWQGPLHCVRLNRQIFERCVHESGLHVEAFMYRRHRDLQSVYILTKAAGTADKT